MPGHIALPALMNDVNNTTENSVDTHSLYLLMSILQTAKPMGPCILVKSQLIIIKYY